MHNCQWWENIVKKISVKSTRKVDPLNGSSDWKQCDTLSKSLLSVSPQWLSTHSSCRRKNPTHRIRTQLYKGQKKQLMLHALLYQNQPANRLKVDGSQRLWHSYIWRVSNHCFKHNNGSVPAPGMNFSRTLLFLQIRSTKSIINC